MRSKCGPRTLDDLQASTRPATSALDTIGAVAVLVVVELNDDVGIADAVGELVQREIELVVTLSSGGRFAVVFGGRFAVARARGCRRRDSG